MNDDDVIDVTRTVPTTAEELASLRRLTLVTYVLYALAWFNGLTAVIAVIINYVKRDDANGTIYRSHMDWMIRSFWWTLLWVVLAIVPAVASIGLLSFLLVIPAIWFLYRMIKGLLRLIDGRAVP